MIFALTSQPRGRCPYVITIIFVWLLPYVREMPAAAQVTHAGAVNTGLTWGGYNPSFVTVFSRMQTPATLAGCDSIQIGFAGERPYMLPELGTYFLAATVPVAAGGVGAGIRYTGNSVYNELMFSFAYGRQLGKRLAMALHTAYVLQRFAGYQSVWTMITGCGIAMTLTDKLTAGWSVSFPVRKTAGVVKSTTVDYSMGIGLNPGGSWCGAIELRKQERSSLTALLGFIYHATGQVAVRFGVATGTSPYWAGISFAKKRMTVLITGGLHHRMGVSPGAAFSTSFSSRAANKDL